MRDNHGTGRGNQTRAIRSRRPDRRRGHGRSVPCARHSSSSCSSTSRHKDGPMSPSPWALTVFLTGLSTATISTSTPSTRTPPSVVSSPDNATRNCSWIWPDLPLRRRFPRRRLERYLPRRLPPPSPRPQHSGNLRPLPRCAVDGELTSFTFGFSRV